MSLYLQCVCLSIVNSYQNFLNLRSRYFCVFWSQETFSTITNCVLMFSPQSKHKWAATWQNQQNECAPQISLGIRRVWSESSLSARRNLRSLATHWVHSEDSDQTGRMPRLIWVFAGRTLILLALSCRGSNLLISLQTEYVILLMAITKYLWFETGDSGR